MVMAAMRVRVCREDAAETGFLFVAEPDAMEYTSPAPWPAWQCDDCGQRWEGRRYVCGYCGVIRDDADALP